MRSNAAAAPASACDAAGAYTTTRTSTPINTRANSKRSGAGPATDAQPAANKVLAPRIGGRRGRAFGEIGPPLPRDASAAPRGDGGTHLQFPDPVPVASGAFRGQDLAMPTARDL